MNAPSFDIANRLVTLGVATSGKIFVGADPLTLTDSYITVTDTGGEANPKWLRDDKRVQIRVRAKTNAYAEGYELIENVREALLGVLPFTIDTVIYTRFLLTSDIMFLGYGPNNRPMFSINFLVGRDYTDASGSNRDVIE